MISWLFTAALLIRLECRVAVLEMRMYPVLMQHPSRCLGQNIDYTMPWRGGP